MTIQDLKIGDKVMRRRSSDKEPQWVETTVNKTYLQLIKDHPEDYRVAMDNIESYTVLSTAIQHGTECKKVEHVGGGYLHDSEDDTPYLVDGVKYCGRCHRGL